MESARKLTQHLHRQDNAEQLRWVQELLVDLNLEDLSKKHCSWKLLMGRFKLNPKAILRSLEEDGVPDPSQFQPKSEAQLTVESLSESIKILADSGKYSLSTAFKFFQQNGLSVTFRTFEKYCPHEFPEMLNGGQKNQRKKMVPENKRTTQSQSKSEQTSGFRDPDSEEL